MGRCVRLLGKAILAVSITLPHVRTKRVDTRGMHAQKSGSLAIDSSYRPPVKNGLT
jgi:hypothetical protein